MEPAYVLGTGGAIGAVARYLVSVAVASERFPTGVLVVNTLGTFLAATVAFVAPAESAVLFLSVGFAGSFTTFSSFSFEAIRLWETDRRDLAILHAVGNLVCCLAGAGVAWLLVAALGL